MKEETKLFGGIGCLAIVGVACGFAFWGGLIYFTFWCAKHFGIL